MIENPEKYIDLLKRLISTPSFSREEEQTYNILAAFLGDEKVDFKRIHNNLICYPKIYSKAKKNVVLNSHHDTVKVNKDWTYDPFNPVVVDGKLFGLGSNDAGGCLVSLIATFLHYYNQPDLPYNLILIISAEEEISGPKGLRAVLPTIAHNIDLAIVGEPTLLDMATAEKGLIVIDAEAQGKAGHAANQYGDNAIMEAMKDIQVLESYKFAKTSPRLGEVKLTVTQISAGTQHNTIPESCQFVIDCRINENYSNEEIVEILKEKCVSKLTPRSTHLQSSKIDEGHSIVRKGKSMGMKTYGSPTMSDQVFFSCPSIKLGPGDSSRSHTADEYIYLDEIHKGIETYIDLLNNLKL